MKIRSKMAACAKMGGGGGKMKKSRFFQWSLSYVAFGLLLFEAFVGGANGCGASAVGMSSPPVNIPAPVAGLSVSTPISASNPTLAIKELDQVGRSQIDSRPDFADCMTVKNTRTNETVTANADADRSVHTEITATVGDDLEITVPCAGETETGTRDVRNNNVISANLVEEVTVSPSRNLGFAHHSDGTDSFIDVYDMANSFAFQNTITTANFLFAHAAFHDTLNEFFLVDATRDLVAVVNADGSLDGGARLPITTPIFVTVDQDNSYALVGHVNDAVSLSIVQDNNGALPTIAGQLLIPHPTAATAHEMTDAISIDYKNGIPRACVLSRYANEDAVLSCIRINLPGTIVIEGQLNLGNAEVSGRSAFEEVVLFADASQILISHRGNNTVIHYTTDGTTFTEQGTIAVGTDPDSEVGSGPIGLVYDEAGSRAFVALSNEDAVQELDVVNRTVVGTFTVLNGLGLVPTGLAMDNVPAGQPPTLMIQNEGSRTVSFINPDE